MSMHGGMALLLDLAGNDIYKGGEFSQGGGYFFAMGMLIDGEGNDLYESQRFGTGFGVHSGVGVLLDHGAGNDRYVSDSVNALGCGWDLGCGYLVDHGGRDSYECNMLGIGAASHNGFALFIDSGGQDSYKGRSMILGYGGTNTYHGGKSVAVFLDAGSQGDVYITDDRDSGFTRLRQDATQQIVESTQPLLQRSFGGHGGMATARFRTDATPIGEWSFTNNGVLRQGETGIFCDREEALTVR
jgi:hypothetical protein